VKDITTKRRSNIMKIINNSVVLALLGVAANNAVVAVDADNIFSSPEKEGVTSRIIGGRTARAGRFPYYASLYRGNILSSSNFFCGASLIASDFIITAAHCDIGTFRVVVGNEQITATDGTSRRVKQKFLHELYDSDSIENDIMLVQLDSPVVTSDGSNNLLQLNFDRNLPNENDMQTELLFAIGLGQTETGFLASRLRFVGLPEFNFDDCEDFYQPSSGGGFFEAIFPAFFDRMDGELQLCAGGIRGRDSCSGDSGGPILFIPDDATPTNNPDGNKDIQLGLTSYGLGCAQEAPAVYTRISGYEDWIKDRVCPNSADPPDFCDGGSFDSDEDFDSGGGGGIGDIVSGIGNFCFSSQNTVEVEGVGTIPMNELKIGDSILVDENKYERVYSFGHRSDNIPTKFLSITTTDGEKLELTQSHLVFVKEKNDDSTITTIPASELKRGMQLLHKNNKNKEDESKIKSITTVQRKGMYAPFTPSGTIIINNRFKVSTFVAIDDSATVQLFGGIMELSYQTISQFFESPRRLACRYIGCEKTQSYDVQTGISTYHGMALKSYQHLLKQPTILFHIGFLSAFFVVAVTAAIESVLSSSSILLFTVFLAGVVTLRLISNRPLTKKLNL